MPFFNRAKKPNQVANPPLDGSNAPIPQPPANPEAGAGADGDGEGEKNAMALARTRTEDIVYPSGLKLALLMTSVFVSMFLVALVCLLFVFCSPSSLPLRYYQNKTVPARPATRAVCACTTQIPMCICLCFSTDGRLIAVP